MNNDGDGDDDDDNDDGDDADDEIDNRRWLGKLIKIMRLIALIGHRFTSVQV